MPKELVINISKETHYEFGEDKQLMYSWEIVSTLVFIGKQFIRADCMQSREICIWPNIVFTYDLVIGSESCHCNTNRLRWSVTIAANYPFLNRTRNFPFSFNETVV